MFRNGKQHRQSFVAALVVVFGLSASGTIPFTQANSNQNPGVLPPNSKAHGKSYGEWGAKWWQWAISLPADHHPLFDETGVDCGVGQSGSVWFLGGVFNESGTATRNLCTIPPGKTLFFPILNVLCSTLTDDGEGEATLRSCAQAVADTAINLAAEIDGVPVQNLQTYRAVSPLFNYGPVPVNNILGLDPGSVSPAVGDGNFLMLAPLSVGPHTIHFHGTFPTFPFTLDVTYNLTVTR